MSGSTGRRNVVVGNLDGPVGYRVRSDGGGCLIQRNGQPSEIAKAESTKNGQNTEQLGLSQFLGFLLPGDFVMTQLTSTSGYHRQ